MTDTLEKKQTLQLLADQNLFVFSDNVSELAREASRDCHAFATRNANKRHHPRRAVDAWFNDYLDTMGASGWTRLKYEVRKITEVGSYVEMSNLFYQGLQTAYGAATGDIKQSLKDLGGAIIDALKDREVLKLLDTRSIKDDRVSISLCKCVESANGEVVMLVCALQNDEIPTKKGETLLGKWEHRGSITYACGATLSFSRRSYGAVRDLIEKGLDADARKVLAERVLP
ncbi:hypothetical protein [Pseudomonas sp. Teo4]|uniref:hypothetical protein n=1 Tax=Pseudomonas sp. Teo4 TaxID=3064528 RepID=UPI002AB8FE4D|nr:hypothetical protein [Pseudomonas sp. Teo4]MDZ3993950.1 hypothetical protein [Pseudomonas sp. Teo4]